MMHSMRLPCPDLVAAWSKAVLSGCRDPTNFPVLEKSGIPGSRSKSAFFVFWVCGVVGGVVPKVRRRDMAEK